MNIIFDFTEFSKFKQFLIWISKRLIIQKPSKYEYNNKMQISNIIHFISTDFLREWSSQTKGT